VSRECAGCHKRAADTIELTPMQPKFFISLLIILFVGLHAVPIVDNQGQHQTYWPFLKWSMYKDSRPAGPVQSQKRRIVGITANGEMDTVTTSVLGLSRSTAGRMYIQPMMKGDTSVARQLFSRLNQDRPDPYMELRVEIETYTITDTGIVRRDNPDIVYRANSTR
jgi:hypothetical protein